MDELVKVKTRREQQNIRENTLKQAEEHYDEAVKEDKERSDQKRLEQDKLKFAERLDMAAKELDHVLDSDPDLLIKPELDQFGGISLSVDTSLVRQRLSEAGLSDLESKVKGLTQRIQENNSQTRRLWNKGSLDQELASLQAEHAVAKQTFETANDQAYARHNKALEEASDIQRDLPRLINSSSWGLDSSFKLDYTNAGLDPNGESLQSFVTKVKAHMSKSR